MSIIFLPGITGLAQVRGIDMSEPLLLAKTEHKMIKEFNLINYFWFIFITLIGNGFGDRVKKKFKKMLIINNQTNGKPINNLVLGGAGFLGSHLIDKLLKKGENVLCIDNFLTGKIQNINHLKDNKKFFFIKHDVIKPIKSKIPIEKIWHLACPASPFIIKKILCLL